jgi:hypothetical protein
MPSLNLYPNAAGDETNWTASAGDNYACIDEETPNDADYVSRTAAIANDLYNVGTDETLTGKNIVQITVVVRARMINSGGTPPGTDLNVICKAGDTTDVGEAQALTTSYASYTETWTLNPDTGLAWTKDDIDALQIGVRGVRNADGGGASFPRVSQAYVQVSYTIPAGKAMGGMSGMSGILVNG